MDLLKGGHNRYGFSGVEKGVLDVIDNREGVLSTGREISQENRARLDYIY